MDTSFRITVECVNNRALNKRAREIINAFAWTELRGKIELENPDVEFVVLEDCEYCARLRTAVVFTRCCRLSLKLGCHSTAS